MATPMKAPEVPENVQIGATEEPSEADSSEVWIAVKAYEIFCARGCEDGHDVEDWLEAERCLRDDAEGEAPPAQEQAE